MDFYHKIGFGIDCNSPSSCGYNNEDYEILSNVPKVSIKKSWYISPEALQIFKHLELSWHRRIMFPWMAENDLILQLDQTDHWENSLLFSTIWI